MICQEKVNLEQLVDEKPSACDDLSQYVPVHTVNFTVIFIFNAQLLHQSHYFFIKEKLTHITKHKNFPS